MQLPWGPFHTVGRSLRPGAARGANPQGPPRLLPYARGCRGQRGAGSSAGFRGAAGQELPCPAQKSPPRLHPANARYPLTKIPPGAPRVP